MAQVLFHIIQRNLICKILQILSECLIDLFHILLLVELLHVVLDGSFEVIFDFNVFVVIPFKEMFDLQRILLGWWNVRRDVRRGMIYKKMYTGSDVLKMGYFLNSNWNSSMVKPTSSSSSICVDIFFFKIFLFIIWTEKSWIGWCFHPISGYIYSSQRWDWIYRWWFQRWKSCFGNRSKRDLVSCKENILVGLCNRISCLH